MSDLQDKIDQFEADADLAHQIVHGDMETTVATEGGSVKSFAKAMADLDAAAAAAQAGSSTTSLAIGLGTKVFTTEAGKQWVAGQRLRAASAPAGTDDESIYRYDRQAVLRGIADISAPGAARWRAHA